MPAHWGVNAAVRSRPVADHPVIESFAHAVQALKLVVGDAEIGRHALDGRQGMGIMGSKLGINAVSGQQPPGTD